MKLNWYNKNQNWTKKVKFDFQKPIHDLQTCVHQPIL